MYKIGRVGEKCGVLREVERIYLQIQAIKKNCAWNITIKQPTKSFTAAKEVFQTTFN